METPLLQYKHAHISYNGQTVVKDFSISMKKGEILGIVGESGSGKSTIIKAAMGLLGESGQVTEGSIFFKGTDLSQLTSEQMRQLRGPKMGMIFQNCAASLCPIRKIGDQLLESLNQHKSISEAEMISQSLNLMEKINLQDGRRILNSYPFELSGGMNQRVGIVMAMMLKPEILFADEPTSALDVTVQAQVVRELMKMRDQYQTSIILVTHNIGVVSYMADQVAIMYKGKLIEYGRTQEIMKNPKEEYTKKLLEAVPRICKE